jgi:2-polyprenyl-3-methyl-5-hydroxy-6-metoxy-1,4-benzoquinol methylase
MGLVNNHQIGQPLKGTVLLATLGERDTIEVVLQEIAESCLSLKRFGWLVNILVVDDSREMEFHRAVENLSGTIGLEIKVIGGPGRGLGAAILTGFDSALEDLEIDVVINLDADGQHDGRQIGDLLRAHLSSGNDITIGSRWTRGGRCYGLTTARVIMSRCSSFALRVNGVPWHVKDPTTSFRIYNRNAIEVISRELAGFGGFSFFGAAIAFADKSGLVVREVPIHFRPRFAGTSNLRAPQVLRAVKDLRQIGAAASMVSRRRRNLDAVQVNESVSYKGIDELELLTSSPRHTFLLLQEILEEVGISVLEIGAGLGAVTKSLATHQKTITACEPNSELFQRLEQIPFSEDVTLFEGTLQDFQQQNEKKVFDSVIYMNVLEHIRDDVAELSFAKNSMSPAGNLIVVVPAMPALYGSLDSKSEHFRRYRKRELETIIDNAGLKLTHIRYVDPIGGLAYWLLFRILRLNRVPRRGVLLNSYIIAPLSRIASRVTNNRLPGRILVAVAVAP